MNWWWLEFFFFFFLFFFKFNIMQIMQKSTLLPCCDVHHSMWTVNKQWAALLNVTKILRISSCFFINNKKQDSTHKLQLFLYLFRHLDHSAPTCWSIKLHLRNIWTKNIRSSHLFFFLFQVKVNQSDKSRKKKRINKISVKLHHSFKTIIAKLDIVLYFSVIKILSGSIPIANAHMLADTHTHTHTDTQSLCTEMHHSAQCYSWQLRA